MKMTWSLLWRELLSQAGQMHRETLSAGTAVGERGGMVGLGMELLHSEGMPPQAET